MDKKNQEVKIRNSMEINEESSNKKGDDINNISFKSNSNKQFYF